MTSQEPLVTDLNEDQPAAIKSAKSASRSPWLVILLLINIIVTVLLVCAGYWGYQQIDQWKLSWQQNIEQSQQKNQQNIKNGMEKLATLGVSQQQRIQAQLQQTQLDNANITQILERIANRQPNDWFIAEAEYLMQIAGRKLWLENDVSTAIALLDDAQQRLKSLTNPSLLTLRQAIQNDVATLKLIPELQIESTLMALSALISKSQQLPLLAFELPTEVNNTNTAEITEDTSDWMANLTNNLARFSENFIKIKQRQTAVEPLMTGQQQWLAKQSLAFKLQQAYIAAQQQSPRLYHYWLTRSLDDITTYFDISEPKVRLYQQQLAKIKAPRLQRELPQTLTALNIIATLRDSKEAEISVQGADQ